MQDWMRSKINKPWVRIKRVQPAPESLAQEPNKKHERKKKNKDERRLRRKLRLQKYEVIKAERGAAEVRCLAYLAYFWPKFNAATSDEERLKLLKAAAANPGWPRVSEALRVYLRKKFERSSFRLLDVPIEKCGTCDKPPVEKHHIVPLSHGGINANDNLLLICCECHNAIHPWMK